MATRTDRRVLVLAADTRVRCGLAALLDATAGLQVVAQAGSLRAALNAIAVRNPDVAVVDVCLNDAERSYAAIRAIAAMLPPVAVSAARADAAMAVAAGAIACCDKDGDADPLIRHLLRVAPRRNTTAELRSSR